jgi:soluble lytic murein transglycosylase-like protein
MGSVLRELKFEGSFLELADPSLAVEYGCKKMNQFLSKYSTLEDAISAYNAGSPRRLKNGTYFNQEYVDKVVSRMQNYRAELKQT